jgi:hypothetical protein
MFFFSLLFQHVVKVDVLKLNPADSPKTSKKPTVDVLEKSRVFIKEANSPTVEKKPAIDDDIDSPRVHKKSKGDAAINTASVLKKPSVEHTESLKENSLVNKADIKPVNQLQRPGLKVDGNEKLGGLGKETVVELLSGTVAIKGYFQFERVISL